MHQSPNDVFLIFYNDKFFKAAAVRALDTLAIAETNRQYRERQREQERRRAREDALREGKRKRIEDASKRIKFD